MDTGEVLDTGGAPDPGPGGLYILWLALPRATPITVGSLGSFAFPAGLYAYVGSAQRNRAARVARHLRAPKPCRWHIDYLREHADVLKVDCVDGGRAGECRLAAAVLRHHGGALAMARFGASDCRCPGHLIYLGNRGWQS